ncbi:MULTISPECIES: ABC transporter permease [Winogradskyella]|uniref:ABC transporter permease n=1 Tax=Winogradskyella TaxID=286104 RepID=UPI0015C98108|nr:MULTISPECIES: ABC transporter permease [Winogradskyella]QXP79585.1 ABC transporter permease [Winogradskyella sp. HaHa_3_26]
MNLKIIWRLLKRETTLIQTDHSILLALLAAPLLYFALMGTTYMNKDEEKVNVGIVDLDHSNSSKAFLTKLNATQKINITDTYINRVEAEKGFNNFDVQAIVEIPNGFEKKLINKESAPIGLILNNSKFLSSNDINKAVNLVAMEYASDSRQQFFESKGINPSTAKNKAKPVTAQIHAVYNPTNNYGNFLLPALLILILHQTLLISLSESIASDCENNQILINFKDSKFSFLNYFLGKTGFYMTLYFAYMTLTFLVAYPALDLPLNGSLFTLFTVTFLFFITTIFYTWFISSFFKSQTSAMEIMAFTSYPVFLITGITWSFKEMPLFLQSIANLIPLRPYFEFLKKQTIMGVDSPYYNNEIIHLLILLLVGYVLAFLRFNYLRNKVQKSVINLSN